MIRSARKRASAAAKRKPRGNSALPKGAKSRFTLFSTQYANGQVGRLTIKSLRDELAGATSIDIASAYYDPAFCESLLEAPVLKGEQQVRVVFNGLGGLRLHEQGKTLSALQRALTRRGRRVEIRIAFERGIFHTKLFIRGGPKPSAFIGSANATQAAMTWNEEILGKLEGGIEPLKAYFETVWNAATPLGGLDEKTTARSLVAFMRTGVLFFKPSSSIQFTLNPFADALSALTQPQREQLGGRRLPFAFKEGGIDAFSLQRAAGLDPDDDREDDETTRFSIRTYAVETCLGYWVPYALVSQVNEKLEEASRQKESRIRRVREAIERIGREELERRYLEYLAAGSKALSDVGARSSDVQAERQGGQIDPAKRFRNFHDRVLRGLKSGENVKRLCRLFVPSPLPDIWDDAPLAEAFYESFFQYVAFVANGEGRKHRVPMQIAERCGGEATVVPEDLKDALSNVLRSEGWGVEDWGRKRSKAESD